MRAGICVDLLALLKQGEVDRVLCRLRESAEMRGVSYEFFCVRLVAGHRTPAFKPR